MKKLKVAIIGHGGREQAIIKALLPDKKLKNLYSFNPTDTQVIALATSCQHNKHLLLKELLKHQVNLVIIGPEQPLANGLGDFLRKHHIQVFGPSAKAAKLEASKIFAKKFMKKYDIPTAPYQLVQSTKQTLKAALLFKPPYVLKADGLAGGKGVFICKNKQELKQKASAIFDQKLLGIAGDKALLEEFQQGKEISVFIITNGKDYQVLPIAKDYKKLYDGGLGPNTGGMGAHAPISISKKLMHTIEKKIIRSTMQGLAKEGISYLGVLYIGLMISHHADPKVLEYNIRFGDPEAQVLLPLLKGSWLDVFYKVAFCQSLSPLKWKKKYIACVVLANKGYPDKKIKSAYIKGNINFENDKAYFLKAGVVFRKNTWIASGGRVLHAIGIGSHHRAAIQAAYEQVQKISWKGMHYRGDIGR